MSNFRPGYLLWRKFVRTNIKIDDQLMKQAMKAACAKTKRETVEQALKLMVRLNRQEKLLRAARGPISWSKIEAELDRWEKRSG